MPGLQAILVVTFFVIVTCYLLYKDHTSKDMLEFKRKERAQHVDALETRNAELLEAVKKAHEILLHEMDNGRTPSMLQGVGLGYFEDVICGVKL